jgi:hypothetical protein
MADIFEGSKELNELHAELSKTSVISDAFKDYIIRTTLEAAANAYSKGRAVGSEELRQEFIGRRFSDKSSVKTGVHNMSELCAKITQGNSPVIFQVLNKLFPGKPGDWIRIVLSGSFEEVEAFREWLWRIVDQKPEVFSEFSKTR